MNKIELVDKYRDKRGINYIDGKLCCFISAERYNKGGYSSFLDIFCSHTFDIIFIERDVYGKVREDEQLWQLIMTTLVTKGKDIKDCILVF
jgi:hypothetical protein